MGRNLSNMAQNRIISEDSPNKSIVKFVVDLLIAFWDNGRSETPDGRTDGQTLAIPMSPPDFVRRGQ